MAAAVSLSSVGEGEGDDSKVTCLTTEGPGDPASGVFAADSVPCGVVGDDKDEDDDDEDDDDEGGVAAPLVSADSFSFPEIKLAMLKNNRSGSPLGLVPFSSVAPWRAMWKAEGVSGSCLSCCL